MSAARRRPAPPFPCSCQRRLRYYGQTVHPAVGAHRDRCPLWVGTEFNHMQREYRIEGWRQRKEGKIVKLMLARHIFAHEYVGGDEAALRSRGIAFEASDAALGPCLQPDHLDPAELPEQGASPFAIFASWCNLAAKREVPRPTVVQAWISLPKQAKEACVQRFRATR